MNFYRMRGQRCRSSSSWGWGDHGWGRGHTKESQNIDQNLVQSTNLIHKPVQSERSTQGAISFATALAPIRLLPTGSIAVSTFAFKPLGYRLHITLVNSR